MAKEIWKIKNTNYSVWVHSGPGVGYKHVGVIYGRSNKEYTVSERKGYWLHIPEGWVCEVDSNGARIMVKVRDASVKPTPPPKPKDPDVVDTESDAYVPDYDIISSANLKMDISDNDVRVKNMRAIFGAPYQFMSSVDPRLGPGIDIGRKYAKEIVSDLPLLLLKPGVPIFMAEYSKKDKDEIGKHLTGMVKESLTSIFNNSKNKDFNGKYYSLKPDWVQYFKYVNPMCRAAARFLDLQDVILDGKKLDEYEWSSYVNKQLTSKSIYQGCTAWYVDADSTISESFSNDTTQSILSNKINGLSDMGRELQFLLGSASSTVGAQWDFIDQQSLQSNLEIVENFTKDLGKAGNIFNKIASSVATVVSGGRMIFPDIWESSSFSRSYSISFKLISPDGDDLSCFLNIIVPMLHLMGLVLPREGASNTFISPFIVSAYYRGIFNIDMGIITSLSFSKGQESAWNSKGIPTVVNVDMEIKDLYSSMSLAGGHGTSKSMNNIILMDYISNMCGININEPDIYRTIDMFLTQNIKNAITDTWGLNVKGSFKQWINNKALGIYGKFR